MNADAGRVALITSGLAAGGAEKVVLRLATEFARAGHRVDLVAMHAVGPLLQDVSSKVRLIDLGAPRIIAGLGPLSRYLRNERPSSMLSAMSPVNCVSVWARQLARVSVRLVLTEHTIISQVRCNSQRLSNTLLPCIMRRSYPLADAIVAVSRGAADDLADTISMPRDRIGVIYNPVVSSDLYAKRDEILNHSWFDSGSPPVVLAVGRLTRAKDFSTLIRAFQLLRQRRDAKLIILGEGELRPELERLITSISLNEHVSLPGFITNPYPYMRHSAVFVSSSKWEGLSNVIIEAMACGMPIVATDCPYGPAEILENGRWGRMVPVANPEALSLSINCALDDPRPRYGERRANDFSVERAVKQYLSVLLGRADG